jgi:VCBS repeat-containing protein
VPAVVGAIVAVVLVAAALGGFYLLSRGGTSSPAANASTPSTSGIGTSTPGTGAGTATAGASPAAGNIIYADSLSGAAAQWPNSTDCGPTSAGYRIAPDIICYAPIDALDNGSVTVEVTQSSGPTDQPYGLVVRRASKGNYYLFGVDSDGEWVFAMCASSVNSCTPVEDFTTNAAIHKGLNTKNTLAIAMAGAHFTFTINGTQVGQVDDISYASGLVGLATGDNTVALFQNITITK